MPTYKAPTREYGFLLHELLDLSRFSNLPGFAEATPDLLDQIMEQPAKFTEEVLQPLNKVGDEQGCTLKDGEVTTPDGFADAYKQLVDGGWPALVCDPDYGGQGLPNTVGVLFNEMVSSANMAFGMYPGLSHGAYSALIHHGSDEQKDMYLPKLVSGEWTGTMNLTEPHCGTDLGLLRSKAVPNGDGSYAISGQKIWISAGEHSMSDNIIHLVLARIEGAPEGVGGISLFIVPKFLVNDDGSLGERNTLQCGGLEEKMGIHGNATCVMNYDGAKGWLVGEENKGLRAMFTMMNEARLGVGLQGISQSEVAYQNARDFALERIQGRALTGPKNEDGPADPIIVHPDVRRMLLNVRTFNEGARALLVWTALWGDLAEKAEDEETRQKADDLMGLMTPILKGYCTDKGFANAVESQQVYGGSGYTREWGAEQFVRDARIAMIYEGTNGIQALDLVGRKLAANGGRAVFTFFKEVDDFIAANKDDETLAEIIAPLGVARKQLEEATMWFMENALKNPDHAGAGAADYLHLFALTAIGLMWGQMAKIAHQRLAGDAAGDAFYETKLVTARYFVNRMLPQAATHLAAIKAGADDVMALTADAF
ncbi:acyl-CoA dehydrogenase C-terminal domain-containing protein [Pyruvatibacter mobilis]|uniref:acyl-CoA dehydrogenase C-terminal domain-containing protein n=1 Tax=Pyruvatibacter mobilis TaxID=1712261 RepID=UPI003BAC3F8E